MPFFGCFKNAFHFVFQSYAYEVHVKFQLYWWYFGRCWFLFLSFVSIENSIPFHNNSFQLNVIHVAMVSMCQLFPMLLGSHLLNTKQFHYFHYSHCSFDCRLLRLAIALDSAMETLIIVLLDASVVRKCHVNYKFSTKYPCNVYSVEIALIMAPNRYVWLHCASYKFPCHDRSNYRMCHSNCSVYVLSRLLNI